MAAQRPSTFACLTRTARNASFAPPAFGERGHGGLPRRLIALSWPGKNPVPRIVKEPCFAGTARVLETCNMSGCVRREGALCRADGSLALWLEIAELAKPLDERPLDEI